MGRMFLQLLLTLVNKIMHLLKLTNTNVLVNAEINIKNNTCRISIDYSYFMFNIVN